LVQDVGEKDCPDDRVEEASVIHFLDIRYQGAGVSPAATQSPL
jgi:hypothetical protein